MQKLKVLKRISLSLIVLGALGVSANAACSDKICLSSAAGIGGLYSSFGGSNTDVTNYGGYLNIDTQMLYAQRLLLAPTIKLGGGVNSLSGLSSLKARNGFIFSDLMLRLGVNVITPNIPLFVSFTLGTENYYGDIGIDNGITRTLPFIGAELQGSVPFSDKFKLDYSVGYNWIVAGSYNLGGVRSSLDSLNNYSYFLSASLGFTADISDKTAFYMKVIGKYYDLAASKVVSDMSYPAAHSFSAMLELGARFNGL